MPRRCCCFVLGFFLTQAIASLQKLSTALNILEKYGSNLTSPNRPKYWRTVKHNNPVFRATVDAIHVSDPRIRYIRCVCVYIFIYVCEGRTSQKPTIKRVSVSEWVFSLRVGGSFCAFMATPISSKTA